MIRTNRFYGSTAGVTHESPQQLGWLRSLLREWCDDIRLYLIRDCSDHPVTCRCAMCRDEGYVNE